MASDPPTKRARTNGSSDNRNNGNDGNHQCDDVDDSISSSTNIILDPITPHVLTQSDKLASAYRDATPYPHGMIRDFCKDGFMEEILMELKHNSKVKFKETDLFRVYQSVDLGNLEDGSELATNMPALMKLKSAIYSPEFRNFVEGITGLEKGTLTNEVDCAANCHAKGCHLLCHDDVIGTRKVSYIIYLTDPSPTWTDEDGGRLELYDAIEEKTDNGNDATTTKSTSRCVPGALPVKTILPEFNSMAYFAVKPGVSFHSVQEVFCDRPRLSIQGWYHADDAPEQMENATLQRLKSAEKGEDTEGGFEEMASPSSSSSEDDDADNLNREDRSFLGGYINAAYLTDESMGEMRTRFEEESSVKLRHFLLDEWNAKIGGAFTKEDERDELGRDRPASDYNIGTNDRWKAVGPAHKQRFLQYQPSKDQLSKATIDDDNNDPNSGTGEYLHHLRRTLFQSSSFGKWLGRITSLGHPLGQRGKVRRFRPGHDYTVAHYGVLTTNSVLDATLCFCPGEGKQCAFDEATGELIGSDDDAIWESGDAGGFECYIAADEGGEEEGPDAEYDDEDDTELLSVSASNNTLSLVYRDPGTMRFVKYVGSGAPGSRWDVALEYDVRSDDTDDEGEEGSKEEEGSES